jgi:hypothetical protein
MIKLYLITVSLHGDYELQKSYIPKLPLQIDRRKRNSLLSALELPGRPYGLATLCKRLEHHTHDPQVQLLYQSSLWQASHAAKQPPEQCTSGFAIKL